MNLYLTETDLFTGRYEGYIRLTDANGDGRKSKGDKATDWGRRVKDSESSSVSDAAVISVVSGDVIIEYRDSGGRRRSLRLRSITNLRESQSNHRDIFVER